MLNGLRSLRTQRAFALSSGSSRPQAASPATSASRPQDPFTRVVNSATCWHMPSEPSSIILISSRLLLWVTAKRRPAPLEGSWKSVKFLNPVRDGAVLPILHLNGYKISGPTVLGRERDENIQNLLEAHGYEVHIVEGDDPLPMHQAFAATLDECYAKIRNIQSAARTEGFSKRPTWPPSYCAA
jgi:XFP-like protein